MVQENICSEQASTTVSKTSRYVSSPLSLFIKAYLCLLARVSVRNHLHLLPSGYQGLHSSTLLSLVYNEPTYLQDRRLCSRHLCHCVGHCLPLRGLTSMQALAVQLGRASCRHKWSMCQPTRGIPGDDCHEYLIRLCNPGPAYPNRLEITNEAEAEGYHMWYFLAGRLVGFRPYCFLTYILSVLFQCVHGKRSSNLLPSEIHQRCV